MIQHFFESRHTVNIQAYKFYKQLCDLEFIEKIYLYGSRARGDEREKSDIDLAILCPTASETDWFQVLEIIEKADTLLEIDCVRYDTLSNLKFKNEIDLDKKALYERS